ncbi:helix-turn-helix domain-containing protein [Mycolicibacterium sp. 120270]|uniref:TetR/AcrR family transcriptional regulator n=1 Tax=Mycolicibacterium sp. 120270 TaxID=3090600 RepID=UPI00299E3167|nr:helix-turn-helix domain-containing protein [Mycolicibacterium sp. 120270]MDX1883718.1 helix-turn-helix domain-containing protein [Mycolicibacterium sp. 120270]
MAARIHSVDPRAERVRAKLRDAAFALAHERPVDQLTVSDIVDRAGVSRQVFYQHFRDRDDAIAYAFAVAFASATANVDSDPRTRIVALFDLAAEHRAMYRNVVPSVVTLRVLAAFRAELEPACAQIAAETSIVDRDGLTPESVGRFLAGGFIEVLRSWMDDEDATDLRGRVTAALDTVEALLGLSPAAAP